MNIFFRNTVLLIGFFLCLSVNSNTNSAYSLLTDEDLAYMREDNLRPSITFPQTGEKYFNQWSCFEAYDLQVGLVQIDYGGIKNNPTISIRKHYKIVEYSTDPDIEWDTEKILDHWSIMLQGSTYVCIFGVFLQSSEDVEIRFIERLKTENGTWDRSDDGFVLE